MELKKKTKHQNKSKAKTTEDGHEGVREEVTEMLPFLLKPHCHSV